MTIAKLEGGQRATPSAETLRDLARALRVSMAALLGSTNPSTEQALADYEASPYYQQLVQEGAPLADQEREWLRYVIESVWAEGKPTPKALHHILIAYRFSPELREDETST
jgi:transcriptional regulator with XRE-family HTH domain